MVELVLLFPGVVSSGISSFSLRGRWEHRCGRGWERLPALPGPWNASWNRPLLSPLIKARPGAVETFLRRGAQPPAAPDQPVGLSPLWCLAGFSPGLLCLRLPNLVMIRLQGSLQGSSTFGSTAFCLGLWAYLTTWIVTRLSEGLSRGSLQTAL